MWLMQRFRYRFPFPCFLMVHSDCSDAFCNLCSLYKASVKLCSGAAERLFQENLVKQRYKQAFCFSQ